MSLSQPLFFLGENHKNNILIFIKDNQCYVPAEVIKSPSFEVSIYCGDLITTNAETVFIKQSGYTSNIINNPAEDTSTQLTKAC